MSLIQATAPMLVTAAVTAGGCLTIALAGLPLVALVLAAGVLVCALLAVAAARRTDDRPYPRAATDRARYRRRRLARDGLPGRLRPTRAAGRCVD